MDGLIDWSEIFVNILSTLNIQVITKEKWLKKFLMMFWGMVDGDEKNIFKERNF